MRFLLDSCISELAFNQLWSRSLDVVWMGHRLPDPGNAAILQMAIIENRVLVTGDKDFGELIVMRRIRQIGLIRLVNFSVADEAAAIVPLATQYSNELNAGAIITAETWRARIRIL